MESTMITTIRLPLSVAERLNKHAAANGLSFDELLTEELEMSANRMDG